MRKSIAVLVVATMAGAVVGCSAAPSASDTDTMTVAADDRGSATMLDDSTVDPASDPAAGAQPVLAAEPVQLSDDLVNDERAIRDPSTPEAVLVAAARRQQAAYRAIGRHPEWDAAARARIPSQLLEVYDRNVDARRQLTAMANVKDTLPAWRITEPVPVDELLRDYRDAESASGVGWNYLAAINLIETHFGSIDGLSVAGAQGPMQFLPTTFNAYGDGGDIDSPRDSIMAAGRYLAANGFADDREHAIYRYNNADQYVQAVNDTRRSSRPTLHRSPAITGGASTTTRPPVTFCCQPVTRSLRGCRSATTWLPTLSDDEPGAAVGRARSPLCDGARRRRMRSCSDDDGSTRPDDGRPADMSTGHLAARGGRHRARHPCRRSISLPSQRRCGVR